MRRINWQYWGSRMRHPDFRLGKSWVGDALWDQTWRRAYGDRIDSDDGTVPLAKSVPRILRVLWIESVAYQGRIPRRHHQWQNLSAKERRSRRWWLDVCSYSLEKEEHSTSAGDKRYCMECQFSRQACAFCLTPTNVPRRSTLWKISNLAQIFFPTVPPPAGNP
jgi:hypothetical protein